MFSQADKHDCANGSPLDVGSWPSVLPFLADQHLPYIVPAIVYWVISLIFHYIDTNGLLLKHKLHTPAEDLTKNRATRKDVVKFALFQQACQCILGYLTAGPDQSVPHEYAIAVWVQKIGYSQLLATQWMRYAGIDISWIIGESTNYGSSYAGAFLQGTPSSNMGNFSQIVHAPAVMEDVSLSSWETGAARGIYWILVPLLQYLS
ncbi:hypothetical protein MMC12_004958, partial [Toensbergia leucococca]|nr:hypothetical protein [Toensbergia leucococca]